MRVLQNVGVYPGYLRRFESRLQAGSGFAGALASFLAGGFEACHVLKGGFESDPQFMLTVGNSGAMQGLWAREYGMPVRSTPEDVLLAQLEEHRAEIFYNLDPARFDDRMLARLPSCVRKSLCWNAAPTPHRRFSGYDAVVSNFPGILKGYEAFGCRTAPFFPSAIPRSLPAADYGERPVDIAFVGGFSRHHLRRNAILDAVASLNGDRTLRYHLDLGRLNKAAEFAGTDLFGILAPYRLTRPLRAVFAPPLYGTEMQVLFGASKIVLNAAIDMSGNERGNIRCFEALSCGALLLSDAGSYPAGMDDGKTIAAYDGAANAVARARSLLEEDAERLRIASAGQQMVRELYSKDRQWTAFEALVAGLEGMRS
jgi:hypothetical protein